MPAPSGLGSRRRSFPGLLLLLVLLPPLCGGGGGGGGGSLETRTATV